MLDDKIEKSIESMGQMVIQTFRGMNITVEQMHNIYDKFPREQANEIIKGITT